MAVNEGVILTAEQVAQWKDRKAVLEGQISGIQYELATITRRLEAVAILSEPAPSEEAPSEDDESPSRPRELMTHAVERIVSQAGRPMSKASLKRALESDGFERSRLGNYFYTVISRLKNQERITVRSDGRVGPSLLS